MGQVISARVFQTAATIVALASGVSLLAGCGEQRLSVHRQNAPSVSLVGSSVALSFAFFEDDAKKLVDLHDSYRGFVNYFDSSEPSLKLDKKAEKVEAGSPVSLGMVRRLPRVQVGVELLLGDVVVYRCESAILNLSTIQDDSITVPLTCVRTAGAPNTVNVDPILVVTRTHIGLNVVPGSVDVVGLAMATAASEPLRMTSDGVFAGQPVNVILEFVTGASRRIPSGELRLTMVSKESGETLVNLANAELLIEDLRSLVSGKLTNGVLLSGTVRGTRQHPESGTSEVVDLPAELRLNSSRGLEAVSFQGERSYRIPVVGMFERIDFQAMSADKGFSGELTFQPSSAAIPETISIASYNVQGFGDDVGAGFPWEFSAKSSNWIKDKMYDVKGKNIAEALALAGSPDIVALQEIKYVDGSGRPLEVLMTSLQNLGYKYKAFGPQRKKPPRDQYPSDTQVIISKFPIVEVQGIAFDANDFSGAARDPIAVTVDIGGRKLRVYSLHAKSKINEKTPEDIALGAQLRADMSKVVRKDIDAQRVLNRNIDIVVTGDFNANYFEDSIVSGLGATGDEQKMLASGNDESKLYNLWYEMPPMERCDVSSGGMRGCIDNMLISSSMYDNNAIQYVDNSFRVVGMDGAAKQKLMGPTGAGFRWATKETTVNDPATGRPQKFTTHLGAGYSDHFPIVASFRLLPNNQDESRATLKTPPSQEINHQEGTLFDRVPYCTDGSGTFIPGEEVLDLSPEMDLSKPEYWNRCFRLENGRIPLKVVDTYDVRVDYGFDFNTNSRFFKAISVSIQWDDRSPNGKIKDRAGKMSAFVNTIQGAMAANKQVYLVGIKGRVGVSYGKVTILAEDAPVLQVGE